MKKLIGLFMMLIVMAVMCGVSIACDNCGSPPGTEQVMVQTMHFDGVAGLISMPVVMAEVVTGSENKNSAKNLGSILTCTIAGKHPDMITDTGIEYLPDISRDVMLA